MDKTQTLIILGIVIAIIITIFSVFLYITQQQFEEHNTPEQLEAVFSRCNCVPNETISLQCPSVLVDWQNSTHYIDSNICKFQLLP